MHKSLFVLLLAGSVVLPFAQVQAASASFCDEYSRHAIRQAQEFFANPECRAEDNGDPDQGRWSTNFLHHYDWCRSVSYATADAGREWREHFLDRCIPSRS